MTVLSIERLRIEFPLRRQVLVAVDDISLEINAGEILGIVGESGAGKSLTGASLIGLLEPPGQVSSGQIRLNGRDITNLTQRELRKIRGKQIGAIFQDPLTSLNPLLTIGRQLTETLNAHLKLQQSEAKERAIDMLREVGIPAPEQRMSSYPHELSGGMRQRVVIALALCCNPELIVADEPTTALDVSVQAQIILLLKKLCLKQGTAVMLVTHDLGVIAEAADRVAVMYSGRLVEIGPVGDIVENPIHPYTKGLMGSIPVIGAHKHRLAGIEGAMPRLDDRPHGCAFHPRCSHATELCRSQQPKLTAIESSERKSACHYNDEGKFR
ncbi:MAG: ABC transporter ATP-binding protein [Roseibium sp.]|uniref:ABC transporter ATP-binding protein n=1 Tax=Roseibium sp. TaxID=1936156 RepID=UPI002606471E|nr:ABC transporter ATP-binding protein [Roseibium sp.]MCV0425888.1 ABC transporter ATP-binding protein [Roseibium sp.]